MGESPEYIIELHQHATGSMLRASDIVGAAVTAGRCASCRWWDALGVHPPYRARLAAAGWSGWRRCWAGVKLAVPPQNVFTAPQFTAPGPVYTAPTFGCVQHEPAAAD